MKIPVVFCFDKSYAPYAAVAISSAICHSLSDLRVYCVVPDSDIAHLEAIEKICARLHTELRVIPVNMQLFDTWEEKGHIKKPTYIRLTLPDLVPEERAIYIDSDTIVQADVRSLFDTNSQGFAICAVPDSMGTNGINIPLPQGATYVNGGVLLMDLEALRKDHFFSQCQSLYKQHAHLISWADQCLINLYGGTRIGLLDAGWNTQVFSQNLGRNDFYEVATSAKVIHFLGSCKPWQAWCNPVITEYYNSFSRCTPFSRVPVTPITNSNQLIMLATAYEKNGDMVMSNQIKNQIISLLNNALKT